ncbi:MAG TPA: Y-family DNA polymerase [Pyrinomonadaceae bacterium]|jgi:DNA polymerase V
MKEIFGLIDADAFYVSCERAFQPALEGKPVVVLSNNDGNIVARSRESKTLGITMGMPFFKAQPIIERNNVTWFSSNYTLYGDVSRRVFDTIEQFVPSLEHYSIDEAFVHFDKGHQEEDAHEIKLTVRKWTGIPVSIGIGPTKVLAKIASHIAKKHPEHGGVVDLSGVDADDYLKDFDVADLWGIGHQYAKFLKSGDEGNNEQPDLWEASGLEPILHKQKIETALELKRCSDSWVRKHLTIKGVRLVWELRGISCLPLEVFEKPRKGLCCSRSFGRHVISMEDLCEAVAMHCARGGEKLRRQRLAASHLTVFISTSRFRQNPNEIYSAAASWQLPYPTSYTPAITVAARELLERVYKPGFVYHKAGVFLTDIVADAERQQNMLVGIDNCRQMRLMEAVDRINRRYGRHTVHPLALSAERDWEMRRGNLSPRYTTRLDEVLRVKAC